MISAATFARPEIRRLTESLPPTVDKRRLKLLPRILEEWAATDLKEHLSRKTRSVTNARNKRFAAVAKHTMTLAKALAELDGFDRFYIGISVAGGFNTVAVEQTAWA